MSLFAYVFCSHCKVVPTGWSSIAKLYDIADKVGFGNPAGRANEFVSSLQKLEVFIAIVPILSQRCRVLLADVLHDHLPDHDIH